MEGDGRGNIISFFSSSSSRSCRIRRRPSCLVLAYTYLLPTYHACCTSLSSADYNDCLERIALLPTDNLTRSDFPALTRSSFTNDQDTRTSMVGHSSRFHAVTHRTPFIDAPGGSTLSRVRWGAIKLNFL
jgi:hypothetical protein